MSLPILAVTLGDPAGIGPEVAARCLRPEKFPGVYLLLIGCSAVFEYLAEEFSLRLPLNPIPTLDPSFLREDSINFLDVTEESRWLLKKQKPEENPSDALFEIGKVSAINASMALASLKAGAYQAATGLVQALVTAPVNKESLQLLEPGFVGHTEYLAKIARTKSFAMMFLKEKTETSPALRMTLVTIHVALNKVSRLITREAVLEKIRLTHDFLKTKMGISKPRIGVAALNPHGRETGDEEEKVIVPAIEEARKEKMTVSGPVSGDTVCIEAVRGKYDAVVAMYHDQALAPFKLLAFDTGVNLTLGLPYVRTSPDHGTAYEIAYQGKADPRSMESALNCAYRLIKK